MIKDTASKSDTFDVSAINADFNTYYLEFVVATKNDIRVFDSNTGKLKKIYIDIHDNKSENEITAFTLDSRHRIFIIGDNNGGVRAYNYSNGALIK